MSGSVLAGIIQSCKAHNKCFTGSPRDATPEQGLHSTVHRVGGGGLIEERGILKCASHVFKMVHPIHWKDLFSSKYQLCGCR